MDLFPDGAYVQLRSRVRGMFLCADDDWVGVSALPLRGVAFLSTVWRVRHQTRNGDTSLLLQGAAYGRYLSSSTLSPQRGHRGRAAMQRYFEDMAVVEAVLWSPIRAQDGRNILLSQFGRYLRKRGDVVTISPRFTDEDIRMTRWVVVLVEAASAPAPPRRTLNPVAAGDAMGFFPDGAFVRLESLSHGAYLYADADSLKVSLRPLGHVPFENTVWRVHHWRRERGIPFLMLQSAAYGRYLGAVGVLHGTCLILQFSYDAEEAHHLIWEPAKCIGPRVVVLRNVRHGQLGNRSWPPTRWMVHRIPTSPTSPALPPAELDDSFGDCFMRLQRRIKFVRADSEGHYPNKWKEFLFEGCSITNLRTRLAARLKVNSQEIVLCSHTGCFGRLIPLTIDLPPSTETINIVVLHATSPAAVRLRYPIVDPPEAAPAP